jgi:hypothetical protein
MRTSEQGNELAGWQVGELAGWRVGEEQGAWRR